MKALYHCTHFVLYAVHQHSRQKACASLPKTNPNRLLVITRRSGMPGALMFSYVLLCVESCRSLCAWHWIVAAKQAAASAGFRIQPSVFLFRSTRSHCWVLAAAVPQSSPTPPTLVDSKTQPSNTGIAWLLPLFTKCICVAKNTLNRFCLN